jgi:hypothetical protein
MRVKCSARLRALRARSCNGINDTTSNRTGEKMPNRRHDPNESHEHIDEQHLAKANAPLPKEHRKEHEPGRKTEGLQESSEGKPEAPQKRDHG